MTPGGWIFVLICSVTVVSANLLLREGVHRSGIIMFKNGLASLPRDILAVMLNPYLLGCLVLYGLSMLIWFRLVATQPISVAYPILAVLTFAGISTGGIVLFQEPFSVHKLIGLGLALSGLVLISTAP